MDRYIGIDVHHQHPMRESVSRPPNVRRDAAADECAVDISPSKRGPEPRAATRARRAALRSDTRGHQDGSAKCWGLNTDGQAGYGTNQNIGNDELPSSLGSIVLF
jgi:hypothetical protein